MFQDSLLHATPAWLPPALELLARHRFATARQLAGCLALDASAVTTTLTRLVADGALRELRPTTFASRDADASAYALTRAGLALLATDATRVRPRTTAPLRSAFSLAHELLVNECALVLETLHARGTLSLLSWHTARERIADVTFLVEKGRVVRVPLIADALAIVEVDGKRQGLLLEIDMGTVSARTMRRKYLGYTNWWAEGGPARRFGLTATRIVTVAPAPRRLARLRTLAIDALDGRGSGLLWFLPHEAVDVASPEALLHAHALVGKAGDEEPRALFAA